MILEIFILLINLFIYFPKYIQHNIIYKYILIIIYTLNELKTLR